MLYCKRKIQFGSRLKDRNSDAILLSAQHSEVRLATVHFLIPRHCRCRFDGLVSVTQIKQAKIIVNIVRFRIPDRLDAFNSHDMCEIKLMPLKQA